MSTGLPKQRAEFIRLIPFLALLLAWAAAVALAPSERVLGDVVKWVYAHASLTQAALLFFLVAGALAALYLAGLKRVYRWLEVTGWMALGLWLLGFLLSTIPARLSWGVWVDLGEPRTQMTLRVLAVGVIFLFLTRWVDSSTFTAIAQLVFSAATLYLNRSTVLIRHPGNAIRDATSANIPRAYTFILLFALLASVYLTYYLVRRGEQAASGA